MSASNLLNLRTNPPPIIIEKVIREKRIWWKEVIRMMVIIAIVASIVYGISRADTPSVFHNFTAMGTVTTLTPDSLTISAVHSSDTTGDTTLTLDISQVEKIETSSYAPLSLGDISVGDTVIAQGMSDGSDIPIRRIVRVHASSTIAQADQVATSTPDTISLATTTATTSPLTASALDAISIFTGSTTTSTSSEIISETSVSTTTATSTLSASTASSTSPDTSASSTISTTTTTATTTVTTTTVITVPAPEASSTSPVIPPSDIPPVETVPPTPDVTPPTP